MSSIVCSLAAVESCERAAGNETLECKANGPPARSPETEKSHRLAVPTYYPVQLTLKRMNGIRSSLRWESNPVVIVYKYFAFFSLPFPARLHALVRQMWDRQTIVDQLTSPIRRRMNDYALVHSVKPWPVSARSKKPASR